MYQRCIIRPAQACLQHTVRCRFQLSSPRIRVSSSTSGEPRKTVDPEAASKLKPWQRAFIIGIAGGFVAGQGYLYYNRQADNNSFVKYKLVSREPVSSTASIFHLTPTTASEKAQEFQEAWKSGVWNVHFKQPQIQIVRAYTPLPSTDEDKTATGEQNLRFLIRHDPHGEVSSYLHRLPIGADIEVRGPNVEFILPADVQEVVFFAGGTGIAPALQIAHALCSQTDRQGKENTTGVDKHCPKLHILWANRRREDCSGGVSDLTSTDLVSTRAPWTGLFTSSKDRSAPIASDQKGPIVKELEDLKTKYPGLITVEYFVNTEGTYIDEEVVFRALAGSNSKAVSTKDGVTKKQVLISGPDGFISYLAGPKEWRNGKEQQGPVGKIVAHAIAQNPQNVSVWKI